MLKCETLQNEIFARLIGIVYYLKPFFDLWEVCFSHKQTGIFKQSSIQQQQQQKQNAHNNLSIFFIRIIVLTFSRKEEDIPWLST